MYLSRIEINGFKSFGEKVVLEFSPGVTGIVGPNGSGKSNVVDAIRWALGEQGYKGIRLEKSDDVIFLGSGGKGKMSRASVEMVLSDIPPDREVPYRELTIARHVYRDGEGEYFMNKAQVRLKDIHETLARLHVSTKNYSIVTQGMSDQLLRFSPQELRATVEDASGVKEWQLKKRDAERKLAKSGEHALQVQALLAELRPYLNNLRTQMKRWERRDEFVKRLQELKELKVYARVKGLGERKRTIHARREELQRAITRLEGEKKALDAEIKEAEKGFATVNPDAHRAQEGKVQALYEQRMGLERELIKIESQLAGYAVARTAKNPDAASVLARVGSARKTLEALAPDAPADVLRGAVASALRELKALEGLFGNVGPAEAPQEIRDAQAHVRAAIQGIERELDEAKKENREAFAREQQLKEALFTKERQVRRTEDDLNRSLEHEAALMEEFGRFGEEERQIMEEAHQVVSDCPETLEALIKVLDASYGGREMAPLARIEEDLIRAAVHLQDIGDVDQGVKAEYDKTEERFTFLTKELEDVAKAKEDLEKLAKDLELEIQKKFEQSFIGVNEEFGKYMHAIFGGGKGELIRIVPQKKKADDEDEEGGASDEEDEEPEKEGIAVRVELPGKRIKSLELLSGGERALTSLAFLFALIATVKPPFVVLDEVDAALDEGNSKRFANLLESVKGTTQCVVVTHNRSTMHAAGALYGVTMGGDGISRILSLKLEA